MRGEGGEQREAAGLGCELCLHWAATGSSSPHGPALSSPESATGWFGEWAAASCWCWVYWPVGLQLAGVLVTVSGAVAVAVAVGRFGQGSVRQAGQGSRVGWVGLCRLASRQTVRSHGQL